MKSDMIQLYNIKNILHRNNHAEENIEMYKRSYKNYHEMKKKIKSHIHSLLSFTNRRSINTTKIGIEVRNTCLIMNLDRTTNERQYE